MNMILFDMVKKQYLPEVKYNQNQVKGIRFKIDGVKYSIIKSIVEDDTEHQIIEEEAKYTEARKDFNDWLISKNFLSRSASQARMIEESYRNTPVKGFFNGDFDEHKNKSYNGIDRNKSYPSLLMKMKYFPVFNEFDSYEVYDGHKVEDYTKYKIRVLDDDVYTSVLFEGKYCIKYGYVLNKIDVKYDILYFRRPSQIFESNAQGNVKRIYRKKTSRKTVRSTSQMLPLGA